MNLLLQEKKNILFPFSDPRYNGLFKKKKITFWVRKFQNFCVWFLTLYAFIISKVIIRAQNYTNASLISAPVVISYQNVRGAESNTLMLS